MTRHSREDALTERQFEILYQSVDGMKPSKQLETPHSLMSTMGWETLETARAYIGSSDTSAARELRFKYR